MALQDIIRALEEQADAEYREVLEDAKLQAKSITTEAKEEAGRIRQRKVDQAEAGVKTKAAQLENSARLQNRRDVAALKDRGIGEVFDGALKALDKVRDGKGYEALFAALAQEALAGVEGHADVEVDPRDAKLAESVLGGMGVDFTLKPELKTAGGVVVVAGDGRIFRRNTLEDRLEKVRKIAQSQTAEILFE
jgi:vacuolar-type H+-ATPase subunit E/Vma4